VSSDAEHNLIRRALLSTAKVPDLRRFEQMVTSDVLEVYADKGYDSKANRAWLQARGIASGILKKGARHISLREADRQDNRRKGRIRAPIERVFAHLKQWQQYRRVRYPGLLRNQLELTLKAVAYNLKRLPKILEPQST
jgi:IS5 family transposase